MNLKPTFLAYLLALAGLADFVLVGMFVSNTVTHGINTHPIAISLFVFTISLFLLSGLFALRMAIRGHCFPFTKPILIVSSMIHVLLAPLIQLGQGAMYPIASSILVGTVYFLSSFKVQKQHVQAT